MNRLFINIIVVAFGLILTNCGGGGSTDDEGTQGHQNLPTTSDITLTHGESVSCSDKSNFSIKAQEGTTPNISLTTNTTTQVTKIVFDDIEGSVTVSGCIKEAI